MRNLSKRIVSLLLIICMLLPVLPVGTFAAESTREFSFANTMFDAGVTSVTAGSSYSKQGADWEILYTGNNLKVYTANEADHYLSIKTSAQYKYVAFYLKNIEDGFYNLTWTNPYPTGYDTSEMRMGIYVMPYNSFSTASAADPSSLPVSAAKGTYTSLNVTEGTITNLALAGDQNGYVVVFRLDSAEYIDRFLRISGITLTKERDIASLPSVEDAKVSPELVQENAISDVYFLFADTAVVNGNTYIYLAMRGNRLVVYDLDERKIIDSEDIAAHPRSVYVDEDGMVWSCGGSGLFMYDPYTGEPSYFNFPKGTNPSGATYTAGVTSDGKGNIYFGTAYASYLGKFNKATQTFSWLGCTKSSSGIWSGDPLMENGNWTGYPGVIYREEDGVPYLYTGMDGKGSDPVHDIIKYDLSQEKIVDRLHITLPSTSKYLTNLNLVGDVLFGSIFGRMSNPVYIDLTGGDNSGDGVGDTMKLISFDELPYGHYGEISQEVDGKVYFMGWNEYKTYCYYEYDVDDRTVNQIKTGGAVGLRCNTASLVTIDEFPGKTLVTPYNGDNTISLYFYNLETGEEMRLENIVTMDSSAAGHTIRAPQVDATGKYVYVGAFGSNLVAKYGIEEGTVVDAYGTYSYQTDSILFHGDYMFTGNYSAGTVTMTDLETREVTPLYTLRYSVFEQCRMWTPLFAENKIFMATTPYSGFGGMLVWYDFDKNLTYVAAGPNPEDVYYADTSGLTEETSVTDVKYTWYNAVTNQKANMTDVNGDNVINHLDAYLADGTRQFRGPIENHVINNMIYKDGLIYGTTSTYGSSGSGTDAEEDSSTHGTKNAVLFVYDIAQMKVIATCDLADHLSITTDNFGTMIPIIDQLAEDPNVPGKFWGVVADTLFTMTYDVSTKAFTINEELSLRETQHISLPGCSYTGRKIIFDGPIMYVSFSRNSVGTYMIVKDAPTLNRQISTISPNKMVMAADGNLYWTSNQTINGDNTSGNHIYRFTVSQFRSDTNLAEVTDANGAVSYAYTSEYVATALGIKGNTVKLLKDVNISEATMAEGVVLDLNGHTITGDVATMQGIVTDNTNGGGLISERPASTAPGQVALKDGNNGYRVVNCAVTVDNRTETRGDDVHFWYRVTFSNADAYALAKADEDFSLGVSVTVDGNSATAKFDRQLVSEWAEAMQQDTGNIGIRICIYSGADTSISLSSTVNESVYGSAIQHTKVEGHAFTLTIPELDRTFTGSIILTNHSFA